jgi:hypothetical protein
MLNESIDTIIVCGGKGTRIRELTKEYGCKSLVPILDIPIISYLTHTIRETVPNSNLILAIDNPSLQRGFEEAYERQGIENYQFLQGLTRGPVQAFYEAGHLCRSDRALIFFGNQLVSSAHLERLLSHDTESMVFSGFDLLSENNCKIATIDDSSRVLDVTRYSHLEKLGESEVYLDVPYVVPNNFFSMETFPEIKRLFVKTPMDKVALSEEENVLVEMSDFPPEFHFKENLVSLEKIAMRYFPNLIALWGEEND